MADKSLTIKIRWLLDRVLYSTACQIVFDKQSLLYLIRA